MQVSREHSSRRAFALLGTVQFTLVLAIGVLTLALPALQRDLRLSHGDLALVTAAYGVACPAGLTVPVTGRLVGRRRLAVHPSWALSPEAASRRPGPSNVTLAPL